MKVVQWLLYTVDATDQESQEIFKKTQEITGWREREQMPDNWTRDLHVDLHRFLEEHLKKDWEKNQDAK